MILTNELSSHPVLQYYDVADSNVSSLTDAQIIFLCDRHFTDAYLLNATFIQDMYQEGDEVLVESSITDLKQEDFPLTWLVQCKITVKGWDSKEAKQRIEKAHEWALLSSVFERKRHEDIIDTFVERNESLTRTISERLLKLEHPNRLIVVLGEAHICDPSEDTPNEERKQLLKGVSHIREFIKNYNYVILKKNDKDMHLPQEAQELLEKMGDSSYNQKPEFTPKFDLQDTSSLLLAPPLLAIETPRIEEIPTWRKVVCFVLGFFRCAT
jgi:hypothetical protein